MTGGTIDSVWVFDHSLLGECEAGDGVGFGSLVLGYGVVSRCAADRARQGGVDLGVRCVSLLLSLR